LKDIESIMSKEKQVSGFSGIEWIKVKI